MPLPPRLRDALDKMDAGPCTCGTDYSAVSRQLADDIRRDLPDMADSDIGAVLIVLASQIAWMATQPVMRVTPASRILDDLAHSIGDATCELTRLERQS